jgi:hypothetical protein
MLQRHGRTDVAAGVSWALGDAPTLCYSENADGLQLRASNKGLEIKDALQRGQQVD